MRAVLLAGQLIIYPTDTLYALGGLALRADAAARVRAAKGREAAKPLPLIAADLEQVRAIAALSESARVLADAFWPGPLTLVLPARPEVPDEITAGTTTVAVRVPACDLARRLCEAGPLISTSANQAGEAAPLHCADAQAAVGASAVFAIDAGPGQTLPSTIVDLSSGPARLLRQGVVDWESVQRRLREA